MPTANTNPTAQAAALFPGFWRLASITRTRSGEEVDNITYGRHPTGSIQYTADGYMSALLTASDAAERPASLTLPAKPDQPDALWALVGKHTLAYSGPWTVVSGEVAAVAGADDGASSDGSESDGGSDAGAPGRGRELRGLVIHGDLTDATLPEFVGSQQRRKFRFSEDGDTLVLVGDLGNDIVDTLVWTRASRRAPA